ncbi:extracellular solute-binding protein [Vibrio cholerae]|uniref:extracellular solute-binding protein n=1 Tax=Vibrio cholerae TaxID=666 RepID=UPI00226DC1FE|nr:extracellular solute-binding protein [Vibrio cholerae]MCX9500024.1 extracellular solute-binding protein [Vibrio cholerae]MCX9555642.1 extracellular solute-binding protein [Vibrio cholerae]
MMNKRILKGTLTAIAALMSAHAFAGQEVTVYTAFETDLLAKYKSAFEKENPDIEIKWVRDSTGIMTAKLLAEKDNPRAEVVWGLAGSSMALLKDQGVLKPYTPKGANELRANLNDPQAQQAWYGNDAFFNAVCFNEAVGLAKESDAAKRVVDWSVSKAANELYIESYPIVGHQDVSKQVPNYPNVEKVMAKMDFTQMGVDRARVLQTWSEKFDAKSEPKS